MSDSVIIVYRPDGEMIGSFPSYEKAEQFVKEETDESFSDVTTKKISYSD